MLVRLAGIEPTTPWFVAKYSIQLSYSRVSSDCNSFTSFPEPSAGGSFSSVLLLPFGSLAFPKKALL